MQAGELMSSKQGLYKFQTTFTFVIEMHPFRSWIRIIFQQWQFLLAKEIEKLVLADVPGSQLHDGIESAPAVISILHCQKSLRKRKRLEELFFLKSSYSVETPVESME